jgi:hypothetical protein
MKIQKIHTDIKFNQLAAGLLLLAILSFSAFVASQSSHAEIPKINNIEAIMSKLKIVRNREDLARSNGKKVKFVGYYISQSSKPKFPGNPNFKGVYIKSQIVLEDGTIVHIFPSWNKQSLRSPSEAEKYKGKIVEAIGVAEFEITSRINPQIRESFINLEELKND